MQGMDVSILTAAVMLAIVILVGRFALVEWRTARLRRQPVLFGEAMNLYGVVPRDAGDAGLDARLWAAARRCPTCAKSGACHRWIAGWRRDRLDAECPNAGFLGELARRRTVMAADELGHAKPSADPPLMATVQAMRFWQ